MSSFQQQEAGWMVYPGGGWRRLVFKMPLVWWRLGLGPLLRYQFLVLTTWGRKSGLPRHTMLEYSRVDGKLYVVSGWGSRAQWYQNLLANPHVTIQAVGGTQPAVARRVTDDATIARLSDYARRSPMWAPYLESLGIAPTREDVIAKKDRLLILTFDPTDEPTPPPLKADWVWGWPLLAAVVLVGGRLARRRS